MPLSSPPSLNTVTLVSVDNDIIVEEIKIKDNLEDDEIIKLFKEIVPDTYANLVIMPHDKIKDISLPVVARNVLKDGISENIWYEEYFKYCYFSKSITNWGITTKLDNFILNRKKNIMT